MAERKLTSETAQSSGESPRRGERYLWIVRNAQNRLVGNSLLLLSLALDRKRWPANWSATARMLGVSRVCVRNWSKQLIDHGLVVIQNGWITPTDAGHQMQRDGCDALPRRMLGRVRPAVLRACAVVCGETVGFLRRGVRTDCERADLAGVSVSTIRIARLALVDQGLIESQCVLRGRKRLVRCVPVKDRNGIPLSAHGSPASAGRLETMAAASVSGSKGGNQSARGGGKKTRCTTQLLRSIPTQAPSEPPEQEISKPKGGWSGEQTVASILGRLVPDLAVAIDANSVANGLQAHSVRTDLRRLAGDQERIAKLLRLSPERGCLQLLELLQVFQKAPRRRNGMALQLSKSLGSARLLMIALDVSLSGARNVAAVMRHRFQSLAGGLNPITNSRQSWSLSHFLEVAAAG